MYRYKGYVVRRVLHSGEFSDPKNWYWVAEPEDIAALAPKIREVVLIAATEGEIIKLIDNNFKE